jgi:hypothetical protein
MRRAGAAPEFRGATEWSTREEPTRAGTRDRSGTVRSNGSSTGRRTSGSGATEVTPKWAGARACRVRNGGAVGYSRSWYFTGTTVAESTATTGVSTARRKVRVARGTLNVGK